jgi:hypothetical protein
LIKWTDSTSYSQLERGKKIPRAWDLRIAWLRLVVHRLHGPGDETWFGSCYEIGIKDVELGKDVEHAKGLLIMMVKDKLHAGYTALAKA